MLVKRDDFENGFKILPCEIKFSILIEIEKETYMKNSTYNKVYLAPEPLNLNSFSSNQGITKLQQEQRINNSEKLVDSYKMNKLFQ